MQGIGRFVGFLVLAAALLAGCTDLVYAPSRFLANTDCRPEKLQNGQCVAAR